MAPELLVRRPGPLGRATGKSSYCVETKHPVFHASPGIAADSEKLAKRASGLPPAARFFLAGRKPVNDADCRSQNKLIPCLPSHDFILRAIRRDCFAADQKAKKFGAALQPAW